MLLLVLCLRIIRMIDEVVYVLCWDCCIGFGGY